MLDFLGPHILAERSEECSDLGSEYEGAVVASRMAAVEHCPQW